MHIEDSSYSFQIYTGESSQSFFSGIFCDRFNSTLNVLRLYIVVFSGDEIIIFLSLSFPEDEIIRNDQLIAVCRLYYADQFFL